jgi:hypothetical protein
MISVVEQRAVGVGNGLQLLRQVRRRRQVIPVQIGVAANLHRVVLVMRAAMEADARPAVREQLALRELVGTAREIAGPEHRDDARDVGAQRERDQVPVQAHVLVELLGNARRQIQLGDVARRLGGELDAALDLANLLGVPGRAAS